MPQELTSTEVESLRNVENQLCLQVRIFESAMTQPGFEKIKPKLLQTAQNVYWGALLTLMALPKPARESFLPVHSELCRLRSALNAFKM